MNATDMQLLCVKPQLHMTAIFAGSVMVHSTLSPFHKYWYTTLVFTAPFFVSRFPHFLPSPVSYLRPIPVPLFQTFSIFIHFDLLLLLQSPSVLPSSLENFRVEPTPNIFVRCIHFL